MSIKVNASSRSYSTALYSSQGIYSLHRTPENYYTEAQTMADFVTSTRRLSAAAGQLGITLYLRVGEDSKPPATLAAAATFVAAAGNRRRQDGCDRG